MTVPTPLVRYRDRVDSQPCPYGEVTRVVTGGDGGIANVHVVKVTKGGRHYHEAYAETYYVLGGTGSIRLGDEEHALRPGAVVVIPPGLPHDLEADEGSELEFIIFGTPAMPIDDERAKPRKPGS